MKLIEPKRRSTLKKTPNETNTVSKKIVIQDEY